MEPSKRLRVLQISHDYEGPFCAICRQYAYAFSDHDVTTLYICGRRDDVVVESTGGDRVLFLEQPNASMRGIKLGTILKIARSFREKTFDVVIAHRYKPIYFAGIMSYFFPIQVLLGVAHEHGVFNRLTRRLFITFWRRNIVCIGVSKSVSMDIEANCGPLRDKGRLFTLPHAVDIAKLSSVLDREEARARLGIGPASFCFGTVGRLVRKKDHDVLLSAFSGLCELEAGCDAELVIVGSGREEQQLKRRARELGIDHRVSFQGHVDDAYRYMKALDVFVLSSGAMEAFGMVLLEAMLARVPVISSDAPGPLEVVGDAALVFKTGDANDLLDRLREVRRMSPAELKRLSDAGLERVRNDYTFDAFRRRVWEIPALASLSSGVE